MATYSVVNGGFMIYPKDKLDILGSPRERKRQENERERKREGVGFPSSCATKKNIVHIHIPS